MEQFIQEHKDTRLIIVDTLQKIREASTEQFSYGSDYEVMSKLKEISDKHLICILVVHHTRKLGAEDRFDTISGTNGLLGCADGALLLQKEKRTDNHATLDVVGRDQQDQRLDLTFNLERCIWSLTEKEGAVLQKFPDPVLTAVHELVKEQEFYDTPSVLFSSIKTDLKQPNALTRHLNAKVSELYNEYHVLYQSERTHEGRRIRLKYIEEETE